MRILLVLICSFALVSLVTGAQEEKKKEKKGAQAAQVSKPAKKGGAKPAEVGKPKGTGKPTGVKQHKDNPAETGNVAGKPAHKGKSKGSGADVQPDSGNVAGMPTAKGKGKGKHAEVDQTTGSAEATTAGKAKGGGKKTGAGKPAETTAATTASRRTAKGKPFKPQKFNLASKSKPPTSKAPAVKFQQGKRIEGSQNWQGSNYQVFRNYKTEWHDRNWWHNNSSNVVFIFGGWYALNNGWWYPAWGYAPDSYYFYNGPIYAYNNLPPDQVIANVQAALQAQGYYRGEVDGLLGPLTREALANYQRDRGLYMTSAIDRPTLESLGMA
jgi:hypothetical protein